MFSQSVLNKYKPEKNCIQVTEILWDRKYLSHVAVICIVPVLVHPVTNVGSIVPKHGITRVHYHCMQSVIAVILKKRNKLVDDKRYNVWIIYGKHKYLAEVWGERVFENLREVKGFWKGNGAIKFSGATRTTPKPLQVHAQDARQGDQFDTLRKEKKDVLLCWLILFGKHLNRASPV